MADAEAAARAGLQAKSAARKAKKDKTKAMAAMLGAELDGLLTAQKEREAAAKGEKTDQKYTLYMTLYQYKSDDADDLQFEPGEILRVYDDEEDWFEGENQQGKRGYFPNTFVRKIKSPSAGTGLSLPEMEDK